MEKKLKPRKAWAFVYRNTMEVAFPGISKEQAIIEYCSMVCNDWMVLRDEGCRVVRVTINPN